MFKYFDILLYNLLALLFYFELIIRRAYYFYTSLPISRRKHFTETLFWNNFSNISYSVATV